MAPTTKTRMSTCALVARAAIVLFTALLIGTLSATARADDTSSLGSSPITDAIPSEFQQRVEETAAAYTEAVEERQAVEQQIADCQARIGELETQLPAAQDRAAEAIKSQYKYQQGTSELIELLFSADGFEQFLATLQYFDSVERHNTNQIDELLALQSQLAEEQNALDAALAEAQAKEEAAEAALEEAKAARAEAQRRAEEEARRRAEEAARQAAAAAASQDQATTGEVTAGGSEDAGSEAPADESWGTPDAGYEEPEEPAVDWMSDRDIFINEWGARIDAYLGGSPLGGYGSTFAAAAWDYGVDPRFSPAIAFAESSLGAYCFLPHNAWGWGSVSWGSWEEAIYAHVAGLARGYGYTVTYEGALKYCPPNADHWYSTVSSQMAMI